MEELGGSDLVECFKNHIFVVIAAAWAPLKICGVFFCGMSVEPQSLLSKFI